MLLLEFLIEQVWAFWTSSGTFWMSQATTPVQAITPFAVTL
jgi:hypothetical protein